MLQQKIGTTLIDPKSLFTILDLQKGMQVADLGCGGTGQFVLAAAKIVGDGGRVYAVDILKRALEVVASKARLQHLSNVKTVWSNLEVYGATNIEPASLDAVFLINTLFQSENMNAICKEAVRLVKPGGKLLAVDWLDKERRFGPAPDRIVALEQIKTVAREQQLTLLNEFRAGNYHFGLIFKK